MKIFKIICLTVILIYCNACCKDKYDAPQVTTDTVSYITHNSAWVNCSIITYGDTHESNVIEGICYNTTGNPTTEDIIIWKDTHWYNTLFLNFTAFLSGLLPNTTYYVKAYAEDYIGYLQIRSTSYGKELIFTTKAVDSIVDTRDNKVYKIIKIGSQVWMAENLNFKPNSGYYDYENESDKLRFGRLYTYEAGICACPQGWHLPSDIEWQILEKELGMPENELNIIGLRGDRIGYKLIEPGETNWFSNKYSTNESGFTALPGGVYTEMIPQENTGSGISNIDLAAFFLTSTLNEDSSNVYIRILYGSKIERRLDLKTFGYSIRCVKD